MRSLHPYKAPKPLFLKDGPWKYQIVDLGRRGGSKLGYVKLIYRGEVVDRALSVKSAKAMAKRYMLRMQEAVNSTHQKLPTDGN